MNYIGAGLPILSLAPEGETAELIQSNNLAYVFVPKDVDSLGVILGKLITTKENGQNLIKNNKAFRKKCERREDTRELVKIFDELVLDKSKVRLRFPFFKSPESL